MQPDQAVVEFACCRRKRRVEGRLHMRYALPDDGSLIHEARFLPSAVVNGFFASMFSFASPQSGLANGPMSGPHSCTDGIAVATPMPVAFHSDHENEQPKPTAVSPRYGRSIGRIWRSACSSPSGWLKTLRSGVLGSRYAQTTKVHYAA
jgi:hypothetical protein